MEGLIRRTDCDVRLPDDEDMTVATLLPPVPREFTKRKFALVPISEESPLAEEGTVNSNGCPEVCCPAGANTTFVTYLSRLCYNGF